MKDYKVNKESITAAFCQEVYALVRQIPVGSVSSYGEIALLLGKPQCSRMVGRALKQVPTDLNIPCHRVVNASGRLVPGWEEQRASLIAESVVFRSNGHVDMKRSKWEYDDNVVKQ